MAPALLPLLIALTVLSTTLNIGLLRRVHEVSRGFSDVGRHNTEYPYVPGEIPGYFRPAALEFEAPDAAYPLDDDHKWASIVPPQRGFIRLGADGKPWAVAMYHQLHCVNGVRFSYVAARDGLFRTEKARADAFAHVNHCFDVLRQSLLCRADTTLLPVRAGNDSAPQPHTRRCRDFAQVRDYIDNNHAFWEDVPYKAPPEDTAAPHSYHE
ncbi:hypothetical protein B0H15DRAFT_1017864 [Mycena belliarum]|uniref:Uncharacterized protein n=1 Tax=Mycena belliarum TaxID=1033014 RepID=A0AAD6XWQ6_9AGAR|nr:hypothetical protein B0H15DRAFT_1017864 [Mycena belliae]